MISNYFKFKTKTQDFINNTQNIITELNGKKVLICGDSEGFMNLDKQYKFTQNLDIIGFVEFNTKRHGIRHPKIKNYKKKSIEGIDFDVILVTSENSDSVVAELMNEIDEEKLNIKILFMEQWRDAGSNLNFLLKHKFDKTIVKLAEKLKNKKVLFYGGGLFFQVINEYFDLSQINAIGIVDKKLSQLSNNTEICGYKLYSPEQIKELNPDYVVVTTRRIVSIYEDLYFNYLKDTKIKIIPLVKRSMLSVIIDG